MSAEVEKVTPEALAAWVAWEPGYEPKQPMTWNQCQYVRHAFLSGFKAGRATPLPAAEPNPILRDLVERIRFLKVGGRPIAELDTQLARLLAVADAVLDGAAA